MLTLPALGLVLVAWLVAAASILLSLARVRRLDTLAPPLAAAIRARRDACGSTQERELFFSELEQERRDAERGLSLAILWPRSMARVALASGTALAVTTFAERLGASRAALIAAGLEFAAGVVGMLVCATLGRQARERATALSQAWRKALRVADRK